MCGGIKRKNNIKNKIKKKTIYQLNKKSQKKLNYNLKKTQHPTQIHKK